jgi:hypothetical protein
VYETGVGFSAVAKTQSLGSEQSPLVQADTLSKRVAAVSWRERVIGVAHELRDVRFPPIADIGLLVHPEIMRVNSSVVRTSITRRLLLIALALVILADCAWLYFATPREVSPAFKFDMTNTVVSAPEFDRPVFTLAGRRWSFKGRGIKSPDAILQRWQRDVGSAPCVDCIGTYVAVELPQRANADTLRQAMWHLSSEGICQAGFLTPGMPDATVYRLIEVRGDDGRLQPCKDRYNLRT